MKSSGWCAVLVSGTDYEAELARARLDDAGIPAVVLSQRDHAFNLTHGYLAKVKVMVPEEDMEEARKLLKEPAISIEELEEAAQKEA